MSRTFIYCQSCECVQEYGSCDHDQSKKGSEKVLSPVFKPYYSESHDVQVNSRAEHEKLCRTHGAPIGDYTKIRERHSFIKKNKEEIIAERYAKIGVKYPKGENVRFDEKTHSFVPNYR